MTDEPVPPGAAHDLGQQVIDLLGIPKDEWEIAALLELMGLRDTDARNDYGARDLFDLAARIHLDYQNGRYRWSVERIDAEARAPASRFFSNYAVGFTFALPVALQAGPILKWSYGFPDAGNLDLRIGSAIALGTIASFIFAGGFMQMIARRGEFYLYQAEPSIARWIAMRSWSISLRAILVLLVPALLLNALFSILPWPIVWIAAFYFAALSIKWLNEALKRLVPEKRKSLYMLATGVGLASALAAGRFLHATPIAAGMTGLIVANTLTFVLALWNLYDVVAAYGRRPVVNPPRLMTVVYRTWRFVLYWLLHNTFLFADRIIAWTSATRPEDLPHYGFWVNPRYELGMGLAFLAVLLLHGVVHHATQRFSEEVIVQETRGRSVDRARFIDAMRGDHRRRFLALAGASFAAVAITVILALLLREMPLPPIRVALLATTTMTVFIVATISYVIFMFGLQDILTLLTLSRVEDAVRVVGIALVANVAVGFVCSRAIHYSAAVFGLLSGAIVLTVLASRAMRAVLAELDYHYYAAY